MKAPPEPLFLARRNYRRRRITDAARVLPWLGLFLLLLPVLRGGGDPPGTAAGGVYLFAVWFGLICAAFLLSRRLSRIAPDVPDEGD